MKLSTCIFLLLSGILSVCDAKSKTIEWVDLINYEGAARTLTQRLKPAGYDNGDLFVCRALHEGRRILGKLFLNKGKAKLECGVGDDGKEHLFHDGSGSVQLLVIPEESTSWVRPTKSTALPPNVIIGGTGDNRVHICRAEYANDEKLIPGKLYLPTEGHISCIIAWGKLRYVFKIHFFDNLKTALLC